MKYLFLSLMLVATKLTFASSLVQKIFDGSVATCENSSDVNKHLFWSVYRVNNIESNITKVVVNLEFLKCTFSSGAFGFERDLNLEKRIIKTAHYPGSALEELTMTRKNTRAIVSNLSGKILGISSLLKNSDGSYSFEIDKTISGADINDNDQKSVIINIQSQYSIDQHSNGINYDVGFENLGAFKIQL